MVGVDDSIKSSHDILQLIESFQRIDDVFTDHFQELLVLQAPVGHSVEELVSKLKAYPHFKGVFQSQLESHNDALPSGPYFLRNNSIHQAWRLYEDNLDAFIIPTVPTDVITPNE